MSALGYAVALTVACVGSLTPKAAAQQDAMVAAPASKSDASESSIVREVEMGLGAWPASPLPGRCRCACSSRCRDEAKEPSWPRDLGPWSCSSL